jgi:quinol monooxygenase YgiN
MHTVLATWYLKPGKVEAGLAALQELVDSVRRDEPDTLGYLVHQGGEHSLPPTATEMVVFLEIYRDEPAFRKHIHGETFNAFLKAHGDLFVLNFDAKCGPFMEVATLDRIAGFLRPAAGQSE